MALHDRLSPTFRAFCPFGQLNLDTRAPDGVNLDRHWGLKSVLAQQCSSLR